MVVLSAYIEAYSFISVKSKSLMSNKNLRGPRPELCGTPISIG